MIKPFQAVFIGFLAGIGLLILITSQIAKPLQIVTSAGPEQSESVINESTQAALNAPNNESCNIPDRFPQSIQKWCHLIKINAQKYNIDESLLAAVMLQESGGDPEAYSKSGAVGLMQIMPRDGIAENFMCINGPCFASRPSTQELLDPAYNIEFGARMLANLFEKHGNWRDSLKFYGPMDVGYHYSDIVLSIYNQYQ